MYCYSRNADVQTPVNIFVQTTNLKKNCFVISDVGCRCDSVCKLAAIVSVTKLSSF